VAGPLSASSALHDRPRFTGTTAWARNLPTPLRSFLRTETGSAAVLLAAAAAALVWVNVDARSYDGVWCPAWFPASICGKVTRVAAGTMTIVRADGISFSGPFELILTHAGADAQVLHVYWPDFGFTCPWFRTFSQALAANPLPLPFNGSDWPGQDCNFAP